MYTSGGLHMENKERRDTILKMLQQASKPVTGTEMARVCQVSRQIIVGDIALLRASGNLSCANMVQSWWKRSSMPLWTTGELSTM